MKKIFMLLVAFAAMWCVSCSKDSDDAGNPVDPKEEGVIVIKTANEARISFDFYTFKLGETITIDWGDGTVEEYASEEIDNDDYDDLEYGYDLEHAYAKEQSYTITVKGKIKGLDYYYHYDLISLDASKCRALEYLNCFDCGLTTLDVSKCTALKYLSCEDDDLSTLDVSKNTALKYLNCKGNKLTSLDISKNTALEYLDCSSNKLTSLDVSKNTALTELWCRHNELSASALNQIFNDLPQGKTWSEDGYNYRSTIYISDNPGTETCNRSIATNKGWKIVDY